MMNFLRNMRIILHLESGEPNMTDDEVRKEVERLKADLEAERIKMAALVRHIREALVPCTGDQP